MADQFRCDRGGRRPGRLCLRHPRAQLGLKTAVVERDRLGGICLNWGCIPTKALLRSSEIWHSDAPAGRVRLCADNFKFDIDKDRRALAQGGAAAFERRRLPDEEAQDHRDRGRAPSWRARARLTVTKDGKTTDYIAKNIVLATGARARTLPGLEPDGKLIWTYREAMVPDILPKSLLVVGSGAIGIEFASFYRTLGAEVTVVEVLDRILPVEDEEISAFAAKAFTKQGMKMKVGTTVETLEKGRGQCHRDAEGQGRQDAKPSPSTASSSRSASSAMSRISGSKQAGIKVDQTHVVIDQWGETGVAGRLGDRRSRRAALAGAQGHA